MVVEHDATTKRSQFEVIHPVSGCHTTPRWQDGRDGRYMCNQMREGRSFIDLVGNGHQSRLAMLPEALDAIVGFRGGSSMKLDLQKALRRDLLRGAFTVCSASLQLIVMKFVFVRTRRINRMRSN